MTEPGKRTEQIEEKELTCIVCPNGCRLLARKKDGGWQITGNQCRRGETFAVTEMTHPLRTFSTTAATAFAETPVIPVRVSGDIPKERIFDVMEEINRLLVTRRVKRGEVLIENVLHLGADVIVTSNVLWEGGMQEHTGQGKGEETYEQTI